MEIGVQLRAVMGTRGRCGGELLTKRRDCVMLSCQCCCQLILAPYKVL